MAILNWKKLSPRKGDKHHWYAHLFGEKEANDVSFDIYQVDGKYLAKKSNNEETKKIGWFKTLEIAKGAVEANIKF